MKTKPTIMIHLSKPIQRRSQTNEQETHFRSYQAGQASKHYFFPDKQIQVSDEGITFLPLQTAKENSSYMNPYVDYIACFFVYDGKAYWQYGRIESDQVKVGKQLGTAGATLSDRMADEGFQNGDGIATGDFYALKDYDPDIFLYMTKTPNGPQLYQCTSGITLKTGSDLFEDRLRFSDGFSAIKVNEKELETDHPVVQEFLRQLSDAPFMLSKDVPDDAERLAGVSFHMKTGLCFDISLYSGGYVSFGGLWEVRLKLPEDILLEFLDLAGVTAAQ